MSLLHPVFLVLSVLFLFFPLLEFAVATAVLKGPETSPILNQKREQILKLLPSLPPSWWRSRLGPRPSGLHLTRFLSSKLPGLPWVNLVLC